MENESSLHEYEMYLPVPTQPSEKNLLDEVRKQAVEKFGGLTITNFSSQGEWRIGPVRVRDQIQIWRILSDKNADDYFDQLKKRLEQALQQQKILITRRAVTEI